MKKRAVPIVKEALLAALILLLFTVAFGHLAGELSENELIYFDESVIRVVQGTITPQLTAVMKGFTFFGSTFALCLFLLIAAVLMIWRKKRWEALMLAIAVGGGGLFNLLLKWIFQRERPNVNRLIEEAGYSFPSGHSMSSFIFYGMLGALFFIFFESKWPKLFIALLSVIVVLTVGISRIYLGVHYPSDVIAGYAAGGVWLVISFMALRTILHYRRRAVRSAG
ncbi:phosphatase PAP2 family protein [Paenibacillus sp. NPDC058071]|uniref:phosphatase PAP2 family protein n=1 Tax=Paenibacillus sp. NPDC058071 TaxID=3346326 RepID=UPI0036D84D39